VVDDEELLASAVSEILANAGHSVTTFTLPADAIHYLTTNPSVDALITDLAMPSMNGFELAKKVRLLNPEIPVILLSGNLPLLKAPESANLALFASTLKKPFTPSELSRIVSETLALRNTRGESPLLMHGM
jgi:DNA-binding NtrC family response regulator